MTIFQRIILVFLIFLTPLSFASTVPSGEYLTSCINCRLDGDNLSCWCYSPKKKPSYSELMGASLCHDIINYRGNLACRAPTHALPIGSYRDSCKQCHFDGRNLSCQCRAGNNTAWYPTTLMKTHRCNVDIRNIDGTLKCIKSWRRAKIVPTGSYTKSCKRCQLEKRNILSCYCNNPETRHTSYSRLFHPHRCLDIENVGGRLTCITQ